MPVCHDCPKVPHNSQPCGKIHSACHSYRLCSKQKRFCTYPFFKQHQFRNRNTHQCAVSRQSVLLSGCACGGKLKAPRAYDTAQRELFISLIFFRNPSDRFRSFPPIPGHSFSYQPASSIPHPWHRSAAQTVHCRLVWRSSPVHLLW